jgi:hypothetical protein
MKRWIGLFCALLLTGCSTVQDHKQPGELDIAIEHTTTEVVELNMIENKVSLGNYTGIDKKIYIQSELINQEGDGVISSTKVIDVMKEELITVWPSMILNDSVPTGRYTSRITVWGEEPEQEESGFLSKSTSESEILYYQNIDEFDFMNEEIWKISSKMLGETSLEEENVFLKDGLLHMKLSKDKIDGGEIQSIAEYGYGIYEIRMKLPSVQSSITGFFMYVEPDFYYEIDIEIFNDSSGTLLLTTYADGDVSNSEEYILGFDPTADFHTYRFEYSETGIDYYVDQKLVKTFNQGIPKKNMRLMVNCWYPTWRGLNPTTEDQELLVDWIKY